MLLLGWTLFQGHGCPYRKRKFGHPEIWGCGAIEKDLLRTQPEATFQAKERGLRRNQTCQNYKKINFCYVSQLSYVVFCCGGIFLQQPQQKKKKKKPYNLKTKQVLGQQLIESINVGSDFENRQLVQKILRHPSMSHIVRICKFCSLYLKDAQENLNSTCAHGVPISGHLHFLHIYLNPNCHAEISYILKNVTNDTTPQRSFS